MKRRVKDTTKWMQDRSVDIIKLTKAYTIMDIKNKIAKYMSESCGTPIERYNDTILLRILKQVAYDYLRNASYEHAVSFMINYLEDDFPGFDEPYDEFMRLCLALRGVQVCECFGEDQFNTDNWMYIDGFHETQFTDTFDEFTY